MKSRILRAAGIAVAMLVPVGGLAALGAGTAGATTVGIKVTPAFNFHTTAGTNSIACAKTDMNMASGPTMWQNTTMFQSKCTATGTTQGGIGTATTITFLITSTGLLITLSPFSAKLKTPQLSVKLKLGTTTCKITFTATISASLASSTHKVLDIPSTHTTTTTVTRTSGSGSTCTLVKILLHLPRSTFTGTLTSNTAWTAI